MARIKDSSVEAVKQAADIVALVEARTRLRKVGGRYTGLCPFHQEKTPSFSVSPDRGTYHCFGCGVGGDAISFVEEIEGVDFVGAIEWLADRFNVPLEYDESSPAADAARKRRERLHALLEQATAFYERYLWESAAGEPVRAYLAGRGLEEAICREFRLGLSPGGNSLVRKAREKGFTQAELAAAGLVQPPRRRLLREPADVPARRCARPRRRLPGAQAARGRSAARQVRELAGGRAVPQVGDPVRAAPRARGDREAGPRARRRGEHGRDRAAAGGLEPVVASMGTALTEQQLKELVRLTQRLFLCFDSDAAGEEATLRGMELALQRGFEVKVVVAAEGQGSRPTIPRDSRRGSPTRSRTRCIACGSSSTARATGSIAYLRVPGRARRACPSRPSGRRRGGSRTTGSG